MAGIIGTAIISASVWLAYRYAPRVAQWLGHTRVMVVLRMSAFIVLCIGVEITWNGVKVARQRDLFRAAACRATCATRARQDAVTDEMRGIVQGVLLAAAALIPIVNPLGMAPLFLTLTRDLTDAERAVLARKVAINGFLLLVVAIFAGDYVLDFFGVTVPVLQIAGGLVVASLGFRLLHDSGNDPEQRQVTSSSRARSEGVLSVDAAAHGRTRRDLGRGHAGRQFPLHTPAVLLRRDVRRHRRADRMRADLLLLCVRGAAAAHAGRDGAGGGDAPFGVHSPVHRRADHVERARRVVRDFEAARVTGNAAFCYNYGLFLAPSVSASERGRRTRRCSSVGRAAHS